MTRCNYYTLFWSTRKIQKEFEASRYLSQKARKLRVSSGVLPSAVLKSEQTVVKVKEFYENFTWQKRYYSIEYRRKA